MDEHILPYAPVVLKLFRDVMYYNDRNWGTLIAYEAVVRKHFASIGLQLRVDEREGYAYLTQPDLEDNDNGIPPLPRLVRRITLTYEATLLCVLLREELQRFDAHEPDLSRLVVSKAQIHDMLDMFFKEQPDRTRRDARFDGIINQVIRAGFLKALRSDSDRYEVKRILKAKISADVLTEINEMLKKHAKMTN